MDLIAQIYNGIISFLNLEMLTNILKTGGIDRLLTWEGIKAFVLPLFPILLAFEFVVGFLRKTPQTDVYKLNFLIHVFNSFISRLFSISTTVIVIELLEDYALIDTNFTWYWFIYSYIAWEFGHYVFHRLFHRVRIFWCLHSTHHTPEAMNLSVVYSHFFLEGIVGQGIRISICVLSGIETEVLFVIMFIDDIYGALIHTGENILPNGRLGILEKLILTPSHHRVHHAKNAVYIDKNYCNLLNIWDKVFGTYQDEIEDLKVEYGITRKVDSSNFYDAYFGESLALYHDIANAKKLKNKFLYLVKPPGWRPSEEICLNKTTE